MTTWWSIKPPAPASYLENFPELPKVIGQLLYNRGLLDSGSVERFLKPEYQCLHSPWLFQDMGKACERIWQALRAGESICVYGDYDADAVTASAVMLQTFRYLGQPAQSYIPDRFAEGYGLNREAFEKLSQSGVKLVITVDCGINAVEIAKYCREVGIDLIITDHHLLTGEVPDAFAVINPKTPGEAYPDDQITGVGVAYKLAQALLSDPQVVTELRGVPIDQYIPGWDKWLLDLVAIGTVADCHSLMGENRILVKYGLQVLAKTKWLGLKLLLEAAEVKLDSLDSKTLGFTVAPRINAAGRLEHASVALDLLMVRDYAAGIELANRLEDINRRRQDLTARLLSEAREEIALKGQRQVYVIAKSDWPQGVVGIVAGKLAEELKRPVAVLASGETESTGSARAGGDFPWVEALQSCSNLLVKFGGHKQAAGLTVTNDNLSALSEALENFARQQSDLDAAPPVLEVEAELHESDLTLESAELMQSLEPYGVGNPKPVLGLRQVFVQELKSVGAKAQHAQVKLKIGETLLSGIAFNQANLIASFSPEQPLACAGELILDSWNGRRQVKFKISHIFRYNKEDE